MPLLSERAWIVECTDASGSRRFLGVDPGVGRFQNPEFVWDWIVCRRTIQFATRELAEARFADVAEGHRELLRLDVRFSEELRVDLQVTITIAHSKLWADDPYLNPEYGGRP